jgi:hypothetical protein
MKGISILLKEILESLFAPFTMGGFGHVYESETLGTEWAGSFILECQNPDIYKTNISIVFRLC